MVITGVSIVEIGCNETTGGFVKGGVRTDGVTQMAVILEKVVDDAVIPFDRQDATMGRYFFPGLEDGFYVIYNENEFGDRGRQQEFIISCGIGPVPDPDPEAPCTISFERVAVTPSTSTENPNGTAIAHILNAQGVVSFSLDEGPRQPSNFFAGLPAGPHTLQAKDENGCTVDISFEVPEAEGCTLELNLLKIEGDTALAFVRSDFRLEYSWDGGATWGPDWQRSCLPAGGHEFAARDTKGCEVRQAFEITDPYAITDRAFYFLIIAGEYIEIVEPLKYDGLEIELNRDKVRHGVNAEFSKQLLGFDCKAGFDQVHTLAHKNGIDTEISFLALVKECDTCGYEVEFRGRLVMAELSVKKGVAWAPVEAESMASLLTARRTSKVDLNGREGLDGLIMDAIQPNKVKLHSKAIVKAFEAQANDPVATSTATTSIGIRNPTIVLGFNNILVSDLEKSNNLFTGFSTLREKYPLFEFVENLENGFVEFSLDMVAIARRQNGDFDRAQVEFWFQVNDETPESIIYIRDNDVNGTFDTDFRGGMKVSRRYERDFMAGDRIFLWGELSVSDVRGSYVIQMDFLMRAASFFRVGGETTTLGSEASMYPLHEATAKILSSISGKTNVLRSSLLGRVDSMPRPYEATGCGAKFLIGSGFMLRGIYAKPFSLSLVEMLDILDSLFCVGVGYEMEGVNEVVTLEAAESFYDPAVLIAEYEFISDFEETVAVDYIYNTVALGFPKWQPEGRVENGLDEPLAKREWQTPIRNHKNEYRKECKAIAGGYLIERQRRLGPSMEDGKEDNSPFLVAVTTTEKKNFVRLYPDNKTVILSDWDFYNPEAYPPGSTLTLAGPYNAGSYTVATREFYFQWVDVFTSWLGVRITIEEVFPNPYAETPATPDWAAGSSEFEAERDQPFSIVRNIYSPSTAYNLRLTPARLFLNHAKFINSGCSFKRLTDIYRSTYAEGNLALETMFGLDETCTLADTDKVLVRENENISIAQANRGQRIYRPWFMSCKVTMDRAAFAHMKANRHGFIAINTPEGWRAGFIISAKYKRKKKTCTLKLLERSSDYMHIPSVTREFNEDEFNFREFN